MCLVSSCSYPSLPSPQAQPLTWASGHSQGKEEEQSCLHSQHRLEAVGALPLPISYRWGRSCGRSKGRPDSSMQIRAHPTLLGPVPNSPEQAWLLPPGGTEVSGPLSPATSLSCLAELSDSCSKYWMLLRRHPSCCFFATLSLALCSLVDCVPVPGSPYLCLSFLSLTLGIRSPLDNSFVTAYAECLDTHRLGGTELTFLCSGLSIYLTQWGLGSRKQSPKQMVLADDVEVTVGWGERGESLCECWVWPG